MRAWVVPWTWRRVAVTKAVMSMSLPEHPQTHRAEPSTSSQENQLPKPVATSRPVLGQVAAALSSALVTSKQWAVLVKCRSLLGRQ